MTRSKRIITTHAFMLYWQARYRGALSALRLANRWNAGRAHALSNYNKCRAQYLNHMLELRVAYTYPREIAK